MIRLAAGLDVRRFCALAGIPTTTWYRQRSRALGGRPQKGPWPRPVRDRVAAVVHAYALKYPAWGHRKIWALTVADGHTVSQRTVHRILDERGLLNGRRYQAERRELAQARRQAFHEPPTRRNRVWQTDFSGVRDPRGRHLAAWRRRRLRSEGLPDLSGDRDQDLARSGRRARGRPRARRRAAGRAVDRRSRRPRHRRAPPIRVVTDNGPCYKAAAFARYIRSRPEFEHVRTRHRSPETNGVIERFYGSIKYEHLYLQEIDDGPALAEQVAGYQQLYNDERPHEAIGWALPRARYIATPT